MRVAELHDVLPLHLRQSHLHHADSSLDDLFARRYHRVGLLPAQHHRSYLGGVCEVVEPGFLDLDAGHGEAFVQLLLQLVVDLLAAVAQGELVARDIRFLGGLYVVVGVLPGDLPQRGVALDADELLECEHPRRHVAAASSCNGCHCLRVYLKHCFVGVLETPHQHHAYQDGVAHLVVDLDGLGIEVPGAERECLGRHEGVDPVEARVAERALVLAEEHHHLCLIRLKHHVAEQHEESHDHQHYASHREDRVAALRAGGVETECPAEEHGEVDEQAEETVEVNARVIEFFVFHMTDVLMMLQDSIS